MFLRSFEKDKFVVIFLVSLVFKKYRTIMFKTCITFNINNRASNRRFAIQYFHLDIAYDLDDSP